MTSGTPAGSSENRSGAATPVLSTPFVYLEDVLTTAGADALLHSALDSIGPLDADGTVTELDVPELRAELARLSPVAQQVLGISLASGELRSAIMVHPHGRHMPPMQDVHPGETEAIAFSYFLHRRPRMFRGGGLRIFDTVVRNGQPSCAATYRRIAPEHDTLVIYPADAWNQVELVECTSEDPSEGRIAIQGWLA
ncbi:hypothetical protein ACWCW7_21980 [Nocardia tengchongensis]